MIETITCLVGGCFYALGVLFLRSSTRQLQAVIEERKALERRHKEHLAHLDRIREEILRCTR